MGGRPPPIDQNLGQVMAARLRHGANFHLNQPLATFLVFVQKCTKKAFSVSGAKQLHPQRGSAPGPRWGLCRQNPVQAGAPRARHAPPPLMSQADKTCTTSSHKWQYHSNIIIVNFVKDAGVDFSVYKNSYNNCCQMSMSFSLSEYPKTRKKELGEG